MLLTPQQVNEMQEASKPLVKFLNEHFHPHVQVMVTPDGAQFSENLALVKIEEFIKD